MDIPLCWLEETIALLDETENSESTPHPMILSDEEAVEVRDAVAAEVRASEPTAFEVASNALRVFGNVVQPVADRVYCAAMRFGW